MGAAWALRSRQHAIEASSDLLPISMKFQATSTNNKPLVQTQTQLPNDIMNEIIERLPAISNFRFKCVSKQWFSLNFEALKLKSQTHTTFGIFYCSYKGESHTGAEYVKIEKDQNDDSCVDGTLSFLPKHRYMRIHDSCNGLLLCECQDARLFAKDNSVQTSYLYVCNPATRKWVEIPYISMITVQRAILNFNPLVSVYFNVIIFMPDYKVSQKFKVFSSETGEWSVSQVDPLLSQHGCYVSKLFYKGLIFAINLASTEMIGFDVKGKLCSRIDLPGEPSLNNDSFFGGIGEFGGCLGYYRCYSKSRIYIWKLESGSWLLKSCFSLPLPTRYVGSIELHPIKDDVVFLYITGLLYSYNIKTTRMVKLCSQISAYNYCLYTPFYLDVLGNGWKMNGQQENLCRIFCFIFIFFVFILYYITRWCK